MMPRFDVIGFGALNIDMVYENVIQEEGEGIIPQHFLEPLLKGLGDPISKSGGGSAANTVYALSGMGFRTGYIGKVGADGDFLLQSLGNVNTDGIVRGTGRSGHAVCTQYGKMRNITIFPGENDTLNPREVDINYASNARFIHMTSFFGFNPMISQISVAYQVPEDVRISFDPGTPYVRYRPLDNLIPFLARTYVLFLNEQELGELTRRGITQGGCEKIFGLDYGTYGTGPEAIAVKRGEDGSYVIDRRGHSYWAPGLRVSKRRAKYPTGTGDAYDAGFLAGLLLERNFEECAEYGNKLGAMKLTVPREEFHPTLKYLEA